VRGVARFFTWDVKASQVIEVYDWARTRHGKKPEFFPRIPHPGHLTGQYTPRE